MTPLDLLITDNLQNQTVCISLILKQNVKPICKFRNEKKYYC